MIVKFKQVQKFNYQFLNNKLVGLSQKILYTYFANTLV